MNRRETGGEERKTKISKEGVGEEGEQGETRENEPPADDRRTDNTHGG